MARDVSSWLKSIEDCRVLRVRFDDDALICAIDLGLVDAAPVNGDDDALDCRLTAAGALASKQQIPEKAAA